MRYTEPEVDEQNGLGLGEDLARAELSRKMKIMRKQDESLLMRRKPWK